MTYYADIENHPFWRDAPSLVEYIQGTTFPESDDLRDALARSADVLGQIVARKAPSQIAVDSLIAVSQTLDRLRGQVNQAQAAGAAAVPQIHQELNNLLQQAAAWPPADRVRLTKAVTDAAEQYREQTEAVVLGLRAQLYAERTSADDRAAAAKAEMDAQVQAVLAKNQELETRLSEATAELANQRQRLDNALNENATGYAEAEARREKAASEAAEKAKGLAAATIKDINSQANKGYDEMQALLVEARETLQKIGIDGTASFYANNADSEKDAADFWRWGAIAALLVTVVAFAASFIWHPVGWHDLTLRVGLGAALAGVSGYAGSQSAGHRKQERKARKFALGLTAMQTYLATTDADKVDDLKVDLSRLLFLEDAEPAALSPQSDTTAVAAAVGKIADAVSSRLVSKAE